MRSKIKAKIYSIIENSNNVYSKIFNFFIVSLIVLNIFAVIFETIDSLYLKYSQYFKEFELVSIIIFTVEYILRVWTCTLDKRFQHPLKGRIRYIFSPLALVDLLAILPFYIPMLIPFDLRFIRILRLFRLFRMFKMARYSESLRLIINVLKAKKEELFITIYVVVILLIFSSSLMYFVEHNKQPEAFSSIPASMWWGIVTLTTVGYGDIYPVTVLGKIIGAFISVLGVGLVALPAGILASGFAEEIQRRKNKKQKCPHCGKVIE